MIVVADQQTPLFATILGTSDVRLYDRSNLLVLWQIQFINSTTNDFINYIRSTLKGIFNTLQIEIIVRDIWSILFYTYINKYQHRVFIHHLKSLISRIDHQVDIGPAGISNTPPTTIIVLGPTLISYQHCVIHFLKAL